MSRWLRDLWRSGFRVVPKATYTELSEAMRRSIDTRDEVLDRCRSYITSRAPVTERARKIRDDLLVAIEGVLR